MSGSILSLNTGSSSIKFSLFNNGEGLERQIHGVIEGIGGKAKFTAYSPGNELLIEERLGSDNEPTTHETALTFMSDWFQWHEAFSNIVAIGHRLVHGGNLFRTPVRVDKAILEKLEALFPMAPLHQPHNIRGIKILSSVFPDLPQIACFDTAFHYTRPQVAQWFALPRELTESGIIRYGFHGLSYEYIARVLPDYLGNLANHRVVVAHLGNGASLCAMHRCQSVDTTMGFTPLDGIPMGRRSGSLDPGVLLYLLEERGLTVEELTDLLYHRSGLLGVSGISSDMRTLLASHEKSASEAVQLFIYKTNCAMGSLVAALGGLDALVFTPCISARVSQVQVWVIPTDEEQVIARSVQATIQQGGTKW
jgi:acetate kinase